MLLCDCWKPPDGTFYFQMFLLLLVLITHSVFCLFAIHFFFFLLRKKRQKYFSTDDFRLWVPVFHLPDVLQRGKTAQEEKNALAYGFANNGTFLFFLNRHRAFGLLFPESDGTLMICDVCPGS